MSEPAAQPRAPEPRTAEPLVPYIIAWAVLLLLLGLSVLSAYLPLGSLHGFVTFGIASTQTAILLLVFMRLWGHPSLKWVFAGAGFFWLFFLFALSAVDYFTRRGYPL
jgi:cytochrome c oxidase subunit IV